MTARMNSPHVLAILIAVVGCGLRLGVAEWQLAAGKATLPDSELYWGYAESIYLQRDYRAGDAGARRTPGYPAFVAACWSVAARPAPEFPPQTPDIRPVLIGQAVLGGFSVWMIGRLAQNLEAARQLPEGSWLIAATLTAADPFALSLSGMVLSESLFTFCMIAAVWAVAAPNANSRLWQCLAGLAVGAAILARPSGLLLAPAALILPKNSLGRGLMLAGCLALLSPWWVRNAKVYGRFVPTTTNTGESLYDGLNPHADGGSNMTFVSEYNPNRPPEQTREQREVAEDEHWRKAAVRWARENPGRVLELAGNKLLRFWSPWPNAAEFRLPLVVVGCAVFVLSGYLLGVLGAVTLWRSRAWPTLFIALAPVVYFMLLHAVFVSSVRYRTPAMPFFYLLSGAGAVAVWEFWRRRGVRHE